MPTVGACLGVEFERAIRTSESRCQVRSVERDLQGSCLIHVPFRNARQTDRHEVQREPACDEPWKLGNRFAAVGGQQNVTTQIEQARELALSIHRLARTSPRRRGEIARDQAHCQKHEQRDPVLRIREVEGAHRR